MAETEHTLDTKVDPKLAGDSLVREQGLPSSRGEKGTSPGPKGPVGEIYTIPERFLPSRRRQTIMRADKKSKGGGLRSRTTIIILFIVVGVVLVAVAAYLFLRLSQPDDSTGNTNTNTATTNKNTNTTVANANTTETLALTTYTQDSKKFSLRVPKDWKAEENVTVRLAARFSATEADVDAEGNIGTPTFTVTIEDKPDDVVEAGDIIDRVKSFSTSSSDTVTIDGTDAVIAIGERQSASIPTTELVAGILYNDVIVTLEGSALTEFWKTYATTFETMAKSYKRTSTTASNMNSNTNTNANGNGNANMNSNTNTTTNVNTAVPSSKDSDDDGLTDVEETVFGTDPLKPDTDGDGYLDGDEVLNGFSPTETESIKLVDTTEVQEYTNPSYQYVLVYPASWLAQSTSTSNDEVILTPDGGTGEFIAVTVENNPSQLTPKQWYLNASPGIDPDLIETIAVNSLVGARSPDKRTVYIGSGNRMFILTYNVGTLAQANFQTTFTMITNRFSFESQTVGTNTNTNTNTNANSNANTNANVNTNTNTNTNANTNTNINGATNNS